MSGAYEVEIPTRWMDTDAYGHVNNAQYYSFFDTALTTWLVREAGVDTAGGDRIGLCVESKCTFEAPLSFPETLTARVSAGHVGRSSARYEIELFGEDDRRVARGYFVHVYVDRETRSPAPLPEHVGEALRGIAVPAALRPPPR